MTILYVDGDKAITGQEYYIDYDPGEGRGIPFLAVDGGFDSMIETGSAILDTGGLGLGLHSLFVRAQDANGQWGTPRRYSFEVRDPPAPVISAMEYFFDSDPGEGMGMAFTGSFGSDVAEVRATIAVESLTPGTHRLYVRGQDSWGRWGETRSIDFEVIE
jgi:hypothetical protein